MRYAQLDMRDNALMSITDKENTRLCWIDALGVEYLSYITELARIKGLSVHIDVARSELPTITSINRRFFDEWQGGAKFKISELDDIKHKDAGGFNYVECSAPVHLASELAVIEKVMSQVATDLAMHTGHIGGYVSIMRGCNNFCHYCIVPYTRGRERSRDVESILKECRDLQARNFKEVTLLGQNVNSYSYEDTDFPKLLRLVAQAVPDMRVRFTTSHPKDMSDETLQVIAEEPNVCKHIHLPVQSGSNRILKLMNRKYTREWYLDRVAAIRRIVPECAITTDIFVGYCSETEEEHQESLSLMRLCQYDSSFMFKYSERPGTYASKHFPDDIPEEVKIRRLNELIALQNELSAECNRQCIGKEYDVLLEGVSKRSREQLFGRTGQNKVVIIDRGNHRIGETVRVRITESSSATLKGVEV